jgi:hypothetical protein
MTRRAPGRRDGSLGSMAVYESLGETGVGTYYVGFQALNHRLHRLQGDSDRPTYI